MDDRIIEFIAGLRAAGVRISIAESEDCFKAIAQAGIVDRDLFRLALRATLVKEHSDLPTFDRLFPLYFGSGGPPLMSPQQGLGLQDQAALEQALRALPAQLRQMLEKLMSGQPLTPEELAQLRVMMQPQQGNGSPQDGGEGRMERMDAATRALLERLAQLLGWLLSGQNPSAEDLRHAADRVGVSQASRAFQQPWLTRRMLREFGWEELDKALQALYQMLTEAGMSQEALRQLQELVDANRQALAEQVGQYVGASLARQATQQRPRRVDEADLMQRPLRSLTEAEANQLRDQVRRLAAQLRSRAALRHKRGKKGVLDPKATIRANLRYGSVPIELRHKRRHLKPKLVMLCDLSTSVRPTAEFMLRLVYELQDQVARARSFAFIADLYDISEDFTTQRPEQAVSQVLDRLQPGYYNTDLGFSLAHFYRDYLDTLDPRTTVIICGDGRNNYNDPRLDLFEDIKRRARRIVWLNPENPCLWGTGDSDMLQYLPLCDAVHEVSNLAQLADAIERLLTTH